MRVVNWNVAWATPRSRRSGEILRRIDLRAPEIVCLTETDCGLLAGDGHIIRSRPDYGYRRIKGRRKIALWAREPWECVDDLGGEAMTPGRFVSGVTRTSLGPVTVVGICIPWFGSRTEARRGPERRERWEDHELYLACLTEYMARVRTERLIVLGDFNQVIGKGSRAPVRLRAALAAAFPPGMTIVTSELAYRGRKSIDHVVLSDDLAAESVEAIGNFHGEQRLSDHFGVAVDLDARRRLRVTAEVLQDTAEASVREDSGDYLSQARQA